MNTLKKEISKLLEREIKEKDLVISGVGKVSRQLFSLRKEREEIPRDFYVQGAMGSVFGIGLGLSLYTKKQVWVLSGEGALLMKLGSLATILKYAPKNLHIVVFDDGHYTSTGGQENNFKYISNILEKIKEIDFRIVKIKPDKTKPPRPDISCKEITKRFREKVLS